jgi:CubicO group peptidase (beta-lactamase class C family)
MKHDIRSVTKSLVSALVGIAADSGAIRSLDAPLLDSFPEYADLQVPERRQITIRHALMMSAGLDWNETAMERTVVTVLCGRYNQFGANPPERLLLDYIIPALPPVPKSPCPS